MANDLVRWQFATTSIYHFIFVPVTTVWRYGRALRSHDQKTIPDTSEEQGMRITAWPVRAVLAGCAGTGAMTATYATERRLRRAHRPLDYDDGLVPGKIVAGIMHLPHVTDRDDHELGLTLRWSYGSAFGLLHGFLRRTIGEPWASAVFGGTLMTATFSLFPLLGRTPPPWRWSPDLMATCLATHAVYVGTVAAVDDGTAALLHR